VYHALAAQDADRVITLCDIRGKLIARHDLRPEQGDPEIASYWRAPHNSHGNSVPVIGALTPVSKKNDPTERHGALGEAKCRRRFGSGIGPALLAAIDEMRS
jgi:hypothetical protein